MDELTQELEQIEEEIRLYEEEMSRAERMIRTLKERRRTVQKEIASKAPPSDWPDMTPERARGWWIKPAGN